MYPSQAKKFMNWLLNDYPRQAVLFVGHSGCGKTMTPKQVAFENGTFYVRLNATGMDNTDLTGLPKITDDLTSWRPPAILMPLSSDAKAILIIDEINRVPTETRHVLMQMLDERQVGELKLGSNVLIVITANPDDPGYQVDDLDIAFLRRCCVLPFEFHWDSFQQYAMAEYESPIKGHEGEHVTARVLAGMQRNRTAFVKEIKNREKFVNIPNADNCIRCSEMEQAGLYESFKEEEIIQILTGMVGPVLATSFVKDLNDKLLSEYKALLDNLKPLPSNVPHPVQIDLLYYVWEDYSADPVKYVKNIHHLFLQLNNDIKLLMTKLCHKYFNGSKTKVAFAPMKADWKKVMAETALRSRGIDEEEVKNLLNNL